MDNGGTPSLETTFWIADWYIDPAAGRILRQGAEVKLEPKVMQVLVCLAKRPGEVLSRETLEADAWRGMVVGYDALTSTIIKLRKAFGDNPRKPAIIETVSKRGYRIIAEVRLIANGQTIQTNEFSKPGAQLPQIPAVTHKNRWRLSASLALLVITFFVTTILLWHKDLSRTWETPSLSGKPTIAILPFINLSGDPQNKYFSDGLAEDLTTDLSKYSGIIVIARTSAFAYDSKNKDIKAIAKTLGAKYIVTGSIRKFKDRVRINVKLIDATTGFTLWAERIDRKLKDIFQVQDEVTKKIIDTLPIKITAAEKKAVSRRYTTSYAAYDLFLRARASYVEHEQEANGRAREYLQQAIKLDRNFARAYGLLALTYIDEYRFRWGNSPNQSIEQALRLGKHAITLDNNLPQAYWVLGYVYLYGRKNHKLALEMGHKTIELDPNHADGYALLGITHVFNGEPRKAIEYMKIAMRLNPHYPSQYPSVMGFAYYFAGNYAAAQISLEKAIELNTDRITPNIYLTAVYQRLGKKREVAWQVANVKMIDPGIRVKAWAEREPFLKPTMKEKVLNDLQAAGLK